MKRIFTLLAFLIAISGYGQDVIISLAGTKLTVLKKPADVSVSDNALDFRGIVRPAGFWVKITGTFSRPVVTRNLIGFSLQQKARISYEGVDIKTNTNSQTLKFVDCRNWEMDGTGTTKISGSGNSSGQLIDLSGRWQNFDLHGFKLNQGRNQLPGSSPGGAMLQAHGFESTPPYDHGSNRVWDMDGINANDEFFYFLLYYVNSNTSRAKKLEVRNTKINGAGRDFWQISGTDSVLLHHNVGTRGNWEQESNHMSGYSLNDGNRFVHIHDDHVTNIPQWIYSGSAGMQLISERNYYSQGTNAINSNNGAYLKGGHYMFSMDTVITGALKAAFSFDRISSFVYQAETVKAVQMFRDAGSPASPKPIELPYITTHSEEITVKETTLSGKTTLQYFNSAGQELIIKP